MGAWNNFFLPVLILSRDDLYPVTVGLANWSALATQPGNIQTLYAIVVTGSLVALVPIMIMFLLLQRSCERPLLRQRLLVVVLQRLHNLAYFALNLALRGPDRHSELHHLRMPWS